MALMLERPGKHDKCCNCEAIVKDGTREGTCLVCGAVWGFPPDSPTFAGETDTEIMPDGSTYRARHSFRVF